MWMSLQNRFQAYPQLWGANIKSFCDHRLVEQLGIVPSDDKVRDDMGQTHTNTRKQKQIIHNPNGTPRMPCNVLCILPTLGYFEETTYRW